MTILLLLFNAALEVSARAIWPEVAGIRLERKGPAASVCRGHNLIHRNSKRQRFQGHKVSEEVTVCVSARARACALWAGSLDISYISAFP